MGLRGSDRPCGRGSMDRSHSRCWRWRRLLLPGRRRRLANRSGRRRRSTHGGRLFGLRSSRRDVRRGDWSSCTRPILGGHGAGRRHCRFRRSLTQRRPGLRRDRPRGSAVALHLIRRRLCARRRECLTSRRTRQRFPQLSFARLFGRGLRWCDPSRGGRRGLRERRRAWSGLSFRG